MEKMRAVLIPHHQRCPGEIGHRGQSAVIRQDAVQVSNVEGLVVGHAGCDSLINGLKRQQGFNADCRFYSLENTLFLVRIPYSMTYLAHLPHIKVNAEQESIVMPGCVFRIMIFSKITKNALVFYDLSI